MSQKPPSSSSSSTTAVVPWPTMQQTYEQSIQFMQGELKQVGGVLETLKENAKYEKVQHEQSRREQEQRHAAQLKFLEEQARDGMHLGGSGAALEHRFQQYSTAFTSAAARSGDARRADGPDGGGSSSSSSSSLLSPLPPPLVLQQQQQGNASLDELKLKLADHLSLVQRQCQVSQLRAPAEHKVFFQSVGSQLGSVVSACAGATPVDRQPQRPRGGRAAFSHSNKSRARSGRRRSAASDDEDASEQDDKEYLPPPADSEDDEDDDARPSKRARTAAGASKQPPRCGQCGELGHMKTSRKCPEYAVTAAKKKEVKERKKELKKQKWASSVLGRYEQWCIDHGLTVEAARTYVYAIRRINTGLDVVYTWDVIATVEFADRVRAEAIFENQKRHRIPYAAVLQFAEFWKREQPAASAGAPQSSDNNSSSSSSSSAMLTAGSKRKRAEVGEETKLDRESPATQESPIAGP